MGLLREDATKAWLWDVCAPGVALVEKEVPAKHGFCETNPPFSGWFLSISISLIKGWNLGRRNFSVGSFSETNPPKATIRPILGSKVQEAGFVSTAH